MTLAEELRTLAKQPVYHPMDLADLQQQLGRLADRLEREEQITRAATAYRQLGEALYRMTKVDKDV